MYGCEQQTIEFFMEKIVLPQRIPVNRKQSDMNNNLVERDIESAQLKTVPILNFLVRLSPKKTLQFLFLVILSLSLISFGFQLSLYLLPDYPLNHILSGLFNVNAEQNIPTLYSVLALLFSSIVLFAIAYAKTVTSEPLVGYWGALSIIFVYLACDEFMVLHERLIDPVRNSLNTSGFFYYAWIIPAGILVLTCLLVFLRFLLGLPAKTRHLFLIAGTVYVSGCIGMEMLGGYYTELHGEQNVIIAILTTIEEFLEMFGVAIFIYALLSYISTYMKGIAVRINIFNENKRQIT